MYHVWSAVTAIWYLSTVICRKDVPDVILDDSNVNQSKNLTEDSPEMIPDKSDQPSKSKETLLKDDEETEFNKEVTEDIHKQPLVGQPKEGGDDKETCNVHVCNSTTVLVNEITEAPRLPWKFKIQWMLLTVVSVSNIVITVIYFAFLYPWLLTFNYKPSAFDINFHAVFALISVIDLFIIRTPIRILHCVYVICYGMVYFIFSLIFWACDHEENILYPSILDWNKPGVSVLSTTAIIFVLMPTVQMLFYGIYRLRKYFGHKNV